MNLGNLKLYKFSFIIYRGCYLVFCYVFYIEFEIDCCVVDCVILVYMNVCSWKFLMILILFIFLKV